MRITEQDLKYYLGIIIMLLLASLHVITFPNNDKYDIYLFYDYPQGGRYLTNILYDISVLFKTSILTYWLSRFKKKIFKPLFITSIAWWVTYFLFYNQIASLILIPLYLCLMYQKNNS